MTEEQHRDWCGWSREWKCQGGGARDLKGIGRGLYEFLKVTGDKRVWTHLPAGAGALPLWVRRPWGGTVPS